MIILTTLLICDGRCGAVFQSPNGATEAVRDAQWNSGWVVVDPASSDERPTHWCPGCSRTANYVLAKPEPGAPS